MVRLFGRSAFSANRHGSVGKRKRLAPSARTPQSRREHHPMFQYALDEYAQTVVHQEKEDYPANDEEYDVRRSAAPAPQRSSDVGTQAEEEGLPPVASMATGDPRPPSPTRGASQNASPREPASFSSFSYYEESFGPAYTGGILTYVYPMGYQSMRPRSAPWKLSILIFLLFTWLSVFIVGHCSDAANALRAAQSNQEEGAEQLEDDWMDATNARWCGSRTLYWLWVASMLITGLAASYCSIIGYIKVRDFAVANVRSHPSQCVGERSVLGVTKSDYYVRIHGSDGARRNYAHGYGPSSVAGSVGEGSQGSSHYQYHPSIYQSDGTPQFWGAHIYRPTQAAVAVTSR